MGWPELPRVVKYDEKSMTKNAAPLSRKMVLGGAQDSTPQSTPVPQSPVLGSKVLFAVFDAPLSRKMGLGGAHASKLGHFGRPSLP